MDAADDRVDGDFPAGARKGKLQLQFLINRDLCRNEYRNTVLADIPGIPGYQFFIPLFQVTPDFNVHGDLGSWRTPSFARGPNRNSRISYFRQHTAKLPLAGLLRAAPSAPSSVISQPFLRKSSLHQKCIAPKLRS